MSVMTGRARPSPWSRPSTDAELCAATAWFDEHIEEVYHALTASSLGSVGSRGNRRLGDLVRAAGDRLPDLLPDRATRQHDDELVPSERLRLERDQGRFL